jgi:hypothetical protein
MSGASYAWDPRFLSAVSWHATPTEYAQCRQARTTAITVCYQQTPDPRLFCELAGPLAAFNPVGALRGQRTGQA